MRLGSGTRQIESDDDDSAKRIRKALKQRQWDKIEDFMNSVKNFSDREFYVDALADWKVPLPCITEWVDDRPNSSLALTVRGAYRINRGWQVRTGARAVDVNSAAWPIFIKHLKNAIEDLEAAASLDRRDPTPLGVCIRAGMGLSLDRKIISKWFREATRRDPENHLAHLHMAWALLKKWGGSHEEVLEFVEFATSQAGLGSEVHVLVPFVHLERWTYALSFDKDEEFASRYWSRRTVREDLLTAYNASLGSPKFRETKMTPEIRNYFALALILSDQMKLAKPEFQQIGSYYTRLPWALTYGNPVTHFERCLETLGLENQIAESESESTDTDIANLQLDWNEPPPKRRTPSKRTANRPRAPKSRSARQLPHRLIAGIGMGAVLAIALLFGSGEVVHRLTHFSEDAALQATFISEQGCALHSIRLPEDFKVGLMMGKPGPPPYRVDWTRQNDPSQSEVSLDIKVHPRLRGMSSVLNEETGKVIEGEVTGRADGIWSPGNEFTSEPKYSSRKIGDVPFERIEWVNRQGESCIAYIAFQNDQKVVITGRTRAPFDSPQFQVLRQIPLTFRTGSSTAKMPFIPGL